MKRNHQVHIYNCPKVALNKLTFSTAKEQLKKLESKANYDNSASDDVDATFSLTDAHSVLVQMVSSYFIAQTLQDMSDTSYVNVRDLFFTSIVATIEGHQQNIVPNEEADQQLQSILDSWKFKRVVVPGDGNCLFTAIAMGIMECTRNGDSTLVNRLQLDQNATIAIIIKTLRRMMVDNRYNECIRRVSCIWIF